MARTYLFIVACIAAVATLVVAQSEQCSSANWGDIYTTIPYPLAPAILTSGIRDWQVKVPAHPLCPLELMKGMVANMCDYDQAPVLNFGSKFVLDVHRTGSLLLPVQVQVIVFCARVTGGLVAVSNNN